MAARLKMTGTLKARMRTDLNDARRARDKLRTAVLSMTLSELRNREIELGREASDDDTLEIVQRAIKRRRRGSAARPRAGREEHAAREDSEAEILGQYTPPALDESEVRAMVREAISDGATVIGAVMGAVMPRIKGRFDGKQANRIAREELEAG